MGKLINYDGELLRINSQDNKIEYSRNGGSTWSTRCATNVYGTFYDLLDYGPEILACTSKGIYASRTKGSTWITRCGTSIFGTFLELSLGDGGTLLCTTSKGLYYSRTKGTTWSRKY